MEVGAGLRRRTVAVLAGLGLAVAALAGVLALLDRLLPPDLGRLARLSTLVVDREGTPLRGFLATDGIWRLPATPDMVAPHYLDMLLAYEDKRFRSHGGVDPLALGRAALQAVRHGRVVSGGSTLTMQVARLLEPRPRTLGAKLVEMARAVQLERRFGKDEILAMYLTLAPFGGNLEGVRAASRAWFDREPAELTPGQAALLVALPQSPTRRRPDQDPATARAARDAVLDRLERAGRLLPQLAREARAEPVPTARHPLPFAAPHLAERLAGSRPPGKTFSGGTIRTTLDAGLQRRLEQIAADARSRLEPEAEVAILVVETADRSVRGQVAGSYDGPFGQVDMTAAVRSPGSALKPFIYGLGFELLALHPDTLVDDEAASWGGYRPRNFNGGFQGRVSVRQALQRSLNMPAVMVLDTVGPARFLERLTATGVGIVLPERTDATQEPGSPGLAVALGGVGITLADLVGLYASLSDGGTVRPLRWLAETPAAPGQPLLEPRAAWYVADILGGTPRPAGRLAVPGGGRWLAFKTGTSWGYRDAWAIGVTGRHTIGVWVGRPDGSPRPGAMGQADAAPLLFRVADQLPDGGDAPPAPPDALVAGPGRPLPATLALFRPDRTVTAAPGRPGPGNPVLLFPPDGAEVELEVDPTGRPMPIPLEATGGTAPYRWLVEDLPVPGPPARGPVFWQPDTEGFARIAVVDAAGRRAVARVRLRGATLR